MNSTTKIDNRKITMQKKYLPAALAAALLGVTLTACSGGSYPSRRTTTAPHSATPSIRSSAIHARFGEGVYGLIANTYSTKEIPVGATVHIDRRHDETGMKITINVTGFAAGHQYLADLHHGRCGIKPGASGAAYREVDVESGKANELWLLLKSDAKGRATSTATLDWAPGDRAKSMVIHPASKAGSQDTNAHKIELACVNLRE